MTNAILDEFVHLLRRQIVSLLTFQIIPTLAAKASVARLLADHRDITTTEHNK
jgi:hypothetical protein